MRNSVVSGEIEFLSGNVVMKQRKQACEQNGNRLRISLLYVRFKSLFRKGM